jgi:hypothetical protein
MTLRVLGAGFGRTGTLSLRAALERLGFGPCYHMVEVETNAGHAMLWTRAAESSEFDCSELLADYAAAVDWPAAYFWRPLLAAYPEARVILTVRDAESWYASFRETVVAKVLGLAPPKHMALRAIYDLSRDVIVERTFGGRVLDAAHATSVFESHNRLVEATVPPERLLVYDVADGWAPLCRFLGVDTPDEPFPRLNRRADFAARFAGVPAPQGRASRRHEP